MLTFLEINGVELNCDDKSLAKLGWDLASGVVDEEAVHNFIVQNS
jgi:prophage maintenance system killer protein